MTHVTKIAAGGGHSLAISSPSANDNLAYSWGYNGFGQLGLSSNPKAFGSYSTSQNRPFANQVTKAVDGSTLSNVTDIAAGGGHSLFIVNDGVNPATLWACGDNAMGQVGDGTTIIRNRGVVQVKLAGVTGVPVQVAAGLSHSLVLMSNKTVWAWGYNFAGQLGNGAAPSSLAPNPKPQPVSTGPGKPLSNIVKIVAIGNQSFALDNLNQLWVWGDNSFGELGNGSSTSSSYAINIKINNLTTGFDLYHP
jgi:alpha-tubulin suppressor-like RCC1 family protein